MVIWCPPDAIVGLFLSKLAALIPPNPAPKISIRFVFADKLHNV